MEAPGTVAHAGKEEAGLREVAGVLVDFRTLVVALLTQILALILGELGLLPVRRHVIGARASGRGLRRGSWS